MKAREGCRRETRRKNLKGKGENEDYIRNIERRRDEGATRGSMMRRERMKNESRGGRLSLIPVELWSFSIHSSYR